ncbi:hypothetical protein PYV02_14770 [Leifsonia sp. H3M29-4]|uniref:hypothetical protein n=1 Tax=Salinibacterium metalliresistens TaxID=3031321 RepID=UPI0023DCADBD|nr:hypothetical protein [Salinibacterium metalliresistens]MDF1480346.1 hypothetical protein [Salinibacterium metalliresistens]
MGVWARGNYQRLGGAGGQVSGTVRIQGTALDPMDRSTAFFPTVATTVVTEALAPGDTFKDQLTFGLGDNGEGVVNEWPQGATGLYYPVVANCTVYGPFTDRPVQSTTVPAGAPVAGTFSATTTTADGPTVPYAVETSETMDEAGFYTAVCSIDYAEQALFTQNFLVEDYYFQDDFGQLVETSIVPFSVEVSTQLSTAEATVGAAGLTDAITPRLTGGAWLRDGGTRVPVEVTGTWYWSATEPVQSASAPSGAEVLQVTSTTLAGPSVPVVAPAPQMPYRSGWVTVQWCVQPSVYVQAACDDYGVPAETVRLFGPEFSTSAPEEAAPSDDISDTAIVTGPVPTAGVNLAYAAYHQADADAVAVCDAANLVFETSPVVITDPGSYDSEPLRIGLEHVGAIAWVLTVTAVDTGDVLFVGECGDPAEVTRVALPTVVTEAIKGGSVGGTIADVAIVEGPIPTNGVELSFAGYLQPDVDSEICDASTLVFESEELLLISQPGEYESEQFDVLEEHVGTVLWSETATIRDDEGAIVWQHVGECGLANETTFVLDVSTEATVRITAGEAAQDVAHVAGPIPDVQETGLRTELVFEAFAQGGSTTCAAEDLVFTTAADPIVVTDEGSFESPWSTFDQSGEVYWVASVRFIDEDTDEPALAHVGECGDPSEITVVELAFTGVAVTAGLWVGLFILLTGGVLFAVSRRRKVDTAA